MSQDDDLLSVEIATDALVEACHSRAVTAGWWSVPATGADMRKDPEAMLATVGWKLALVHSEVSEATEGIRKDKMDEHLPQFRSGEVEFADAIIRLCDLSGALGYRLGEALSAKLAYNAQRPDHKPAHRAAEGGKKY